MKIIIDDKLTGHDEILMYVNAISADDITSALTHLTTSMSNITGAVNRMYDAGQFTLLEYEHAFNTVRRGEKIVILLEAMLNYLKGREDEIQGSHEDLYGEGGGFE